MEALTPIIQPAKQYSHTDDLCIISSFYNPVSYQTKPKNFYRFIESIESAGLKYKIVECTFGKQPFTLKASKDIIQVRAQDVLWQKERLLNIALDHVPVKSKKIAWIDCDVLFENKDWAIETVRALKFHKVIQPFKEVIRLPKHAQFYEGKGERYFSFAYLMKTDPARLFDHKFDLHGHTGFAWASHKEIFRKHGFYDFCIAGSGDHMMAHSFVGDWTTKCVKRVIGNNESFYDSYAEWSKKIYPSVKSKIGYVDGTLLHLWHGDVSDRNYVLRQRFLEENSFSPKKHLRLNKHQCWSWTNVPSEMKTWATEYFALRKED